MQIWKYVITPSYKWTGTHLSLRPISSPPCQIHFFISLHYFPTNDIFPSICLGQSVSGKAMIKNTTVIMKTKHKYEKQKDSRGSSAFQCNGRRVLYLHYEYLPPLSPPPLFFLSLLNQASHRILHRGFFA